MNKKLGVLVVDDSVFMRQALSRRIEEDPRFKVIDTAVDGRSGVDKALRLRPDVITMDVEMPDMNGLEALRHIVAHTNIPVIMVSAVTDAGARATMNALRIGAVDFIPKSQGTELIHEKLLAAVEAKKKIDRTSFSRPPGLPKSQPPSPRSTVGPSLKAPVAPNSGARAHLPAPQSAFRQPALTHQPEVIVIGSSTGGPQALNTLISRLSPKLKQPVLIAQHMPAQFTKALAQQLNDVTKLTVLEASDGETLKSQTVYIAPGGMQMTVTKDRKIALLPDTGQSVYRPSVNVLAASVHAVFGGRVLAVMLTGMGSDGAEGFAKLHQSGATTIAQNEASCVVYGMPRAVVEAGVANLVLPIDRISDEINQMLRLA